MTLSTFALASRNAAAPLEARSSFRASAGCAPPEKPYGLEDDGFVDRSMLVIFIDSIFVGVNMSENAARGKMFRIGGLLGLPRSGGRGIEMGQRHLRRLAVRPPDAMKISDHYYTDTALRWRLRLVMTEAMACGTPVLAFRQGSGNHRLGRHGCGFRV